MYRWAFLTILFLISGCNIYEIAGDNTELSNAFEDLRPHFYLDQNYVQVASGTDNFSINSVFLKINGSEIFTGVNGEDFKATGKIIIQTPPSSILGLQGSITAIRIDDHTIQINFNTPGIIGPLASSDELEFDIDSTAYTNNTGFPVQNTHQSITFGP